MPTIDRTVIDSFGPTQSTMVWNGSTLPIYGTLEKADNYFASMLEGQLWAYKDRDLRMRALVSATKRIDRLNFIGEQADAEQPLQFPRGTDTLVPVEIEQACYEVAYALLKGVDLDTERDNLSMTVQAFGGLRSEHDRSIVPLYLASGIPSATAWDLLLPYLQGRRGLQMERLS